MKAAPAQDERLTPEEQAGAWCARLATGNLPSTQQAEFDTWLTSDPVHVELFDQAVVAWHRLSAIAESPEIIAHRADALDALRRVNCERWSRNLAKRWCWGLGLAASVILIVLTFLPTTSATPDIYATTVGERRIITLADGSRLSLDANTRVSVLYKKDRRALTLLNGRAKFEVTKNADRPFTVMAGGRTTIATGTAFSVELLSRRLHVVLYDGRVEVMKGILSSADTPARTGPSHIGGLVLVPGDELVTDLSPSAVPTVGRADLVGSLAWENGQLNFVDEPLASAVEQFNRYSRTRITVGDDRASAVRVNGVFNAGESKAFLDAVTKIYRLQAVASGAEIVVTSRNQKMK